MRSQPYELSESPSISSPYGRATAISSRQYDNSLHAHVTNKATTHLSELMALDTLAVRQAEDRQIVEEHYLAEMKRAVAQANKADADCDDARRRIKQLKNVLEAVKHKKNSTAAIVQDYKSRLEAMMATVQGNQSQISMLEERQSSSAASEAKAVEQRKQQLAEHTSKGGKNTSLEDLRYEAECEERRVMNLRQRHIDSYQLARDVRADLEILQSTLHKLEGRRSELETVRLQLSAMEADEGYRDAALSFEEYGSLMEKIKWQQKELSATRIEGQSMVMHLIEGAKSRSAAIEKERKRLVDQYVAKNGALSHGSEEALAELFRANKAHRSGLVSVIVNAAAEKEAMEQYIAVLSERCGSLLKQLREAEEHSMVKSPDRMPRSS